MATSQTFRSAFNGFNREDVVAYIEYINTKHNNQLSQLREELKNAEDELARLRRIPQPVPGFDEEALRKKCADLESENTRLTSENKQFQKDLEDLLEQPSGSTELEQLQKALAEARAEKDALQAQLAADASEKADLQASLASASADADKLRGELSAAEAERDAAVARVGKAQDIAQKELEAYRRAERTEREARERVAQLYDGVTGTFAEAQSRICAAAQELGDISAQASAQVAKLQQALNQGSDILGDTAAQLAAVQPFSAEED